MANKDEKSGYLVCQGAQLTCSYAVVKTPFPIKVVTQNVCYINAIEPANPVVCDKETNIASVNFGNCYIPGATSTTPCNPDLKWTDTYPHVSLENGGKLLLHNSKATCKCGGLVSITHHGQKMQPTVIHLDNITVDSSSINILNDSEIANNIKKKPLKTGRVSQIKGIINDSEILATGQKLHEIFIKNNKQTFEVIDFTCDEQLINWVIQKKRGKTWEIHKKFIKWGKVLQNIIFKEFGEYAIEAYGNKHEFYDKCTLYINVVPNSIETIQVITQNRKEAYNYKPRNKGEDLIPIFRENLFEIKIVYKFEEDRNFVLGHDLFWFIDDYKNSATLINTNHEKIGFNNPSTKDSTFGNYYDNIYFRRDYNKNSQKEITFIVRIKNYGVYSFLLKRDGTMFDEILSHIRIEVIPVKPEFIKLGKNMYRQGELIKVIALRRMNQESVTVHNAEKIVWKLYAYQWKNKKRIEVEARKEGFEKAIDEKGYPLTGLNGELEFSMNTCSDYKIVAKLEKDYSQFRFNSKIYDDQTFTVTRNDPLSISTKGGTSLGGIYSAFVNEQLSLNVSDYKFKDTFEDSKYLSERNDIKWAIFDSSKKLIIKVINKKTEIEKDCVNDFVEINYSDVSDKIDLEFYKEGEFYVEAYRYSYEISKDKVSIPKTARKFSVSEAKVEDAFWMFATGEKTNKAGIEQRVVCITEAKSFAGRSCNVFVWATEAIAEPDIHSPFSSENAFTINKDGIKTKFNKDGYLYVDFTFKEEDFNKACQFDFQKINPEEDWSVSLFFTIVFTDNLDEIEATTKEIFITAEDKEHYYLFDNEICVGNKPKVLHYYFKKMNENKFLISPVKYGDSVKLLAQTVNMQNQTIEFKLFTDEARTNPITGVEYIADIDDDGIAEVQVDTKKEWGKNDDIVSIVYAKIEVKTESGNLMPNLAYACKNHPVKLTVNEEGSGEKSQLCEGLVSVQWTEHNIRKGCPNCKKEITMDDILKIVDTSPIAKIEDTEFRKKCLEVLNKLRESFHIDTCARKAHFIAQICAETNLLLLGMIEPGKNEDGTWKKFSANALAKAWPKLYSVNGAGKTPNAEAEKWAKASTEDFLNHKYGTQYGNASNEGYKYRGRGLIHLTFKGKEASKDGYIGAQMFIRDTPELQSIIDGQPEPDFINSPDLVGENPVYAALTALWFWTKSNAYIQADWGCEEDDTYNVRRITNGGFIGVENVQRYLKRAKDVFLTDECPEAFKNRKNRPAREGERAPWMDLAFNEAKMAKGIAESKDPTLTMRGKKYNGPTNAWCAAFAKWCIKKSDYSSPTSNLSGDWLNHTSLKEITDEELTYGALVVFQQYINGVKNGGKGHISFFYGRYSGPNGKGWVCLGGNQSSTIKFSPYYKSTKVTDSDGNYRYDLIVEKIYLPKDYIPTESDENINEYTYKDVQTLNTNLNKGIKTSENDQT